MRSGGLCFFGLALLAGGCELDRDALAGGDAAADAGRFDGAAPAADAATPGRDAGPPLTDAHVPAADAAAPDASSPEDAPAADATLPADAAPSDAAAPDASPPDAAAPDASLPDAAAPDAATPDASLPEDAAAPDASPPDAAAPDASPPDASLPEDAAASDASLPEDAAAPDASPSDAAAPDAALPDAAAPAPVCDAPSILEIGPAAGSIEVVAALVVGWLRPICGVVGDGPPLDRHRQVAVRVRLDRPSDVVVRSPGGNLWTWGAAFCDDLEPLPGCGATGGHKATVFRHVPAGDYGLTILRTLGGGATVEVRPIEGVCDDGRDGDGDGRPDLADPGCAFARDANEADPPAPPACANGLDDDGDGAADWPADADCAAAGAATEAPRCGARPVIDVGPGRTRVIAPADPQRGADAPPAEVVLAVHTAERSDVEVAADRFVTWDVRTACDDAATSLGTLNALPLGEHPALLRLPERPPGVTYVVVRSLYENLHFPRTPGWVDLTVDVTPMRGACVNGADDDADGRVDAADPGCSDLRDDSEADPAAPPACHDGRDDDADGLVDWPADPDCATAGDEHELRLCAATEIDAWLDEAGGVVHFDTRGRLPVRRAHCDRADGWEEDRAVSAVALSLSEPRFVSFTVASDASTDLVEVLEDCDDPTSLVECWTSEERQQPWPRLLAPGRYVFLVVPRQVGEGDLVVRTDPFPAACANGEDDDGDGRADAADPGCRDAEDLSEGDPPAAVRACANGRDDDGDGAIDWPADPGCATAGAPFEGPPCAAVEPIGTIYARQSASFAIDLAGLPSRADEAPCPLDGRANGACGGEVAIALVLEERTRFRLEWRDESGEPDSVSPYFYIRTACDDPATAMRCFTYRGEPRDVELAAGTYFLFVDRDCTRAFVPSGQLLLELPPFAEGP